MTHKLQDPKIIKQLAYLIAEQATTLGHTKIMEVCGTHTMSIARAGIKELLPKNIQMVSGPGCPVCVTPNSTIDKMIALAQNPEVIITTFGDMMRVPGSESSLLNEQAKGANIQIVYSPIDTLKIAEDNPDKKVVFLAVGFETTTPLTASLVQNAKDKKLKNLYVLCCHKTMPNAIDAIINDPAINIDALLLPGHVSTIIGLQAYYFIAKTYNTPGTITGFEPAEILIGIYECLKNLNEIQNGKSANIINAYQRGCKNEGNPVARALINKVFKQVDSQWRGLGTIPDSGLGFRDEYAQFDAIKNIDILPCKTHNHSKCMCGNVLRGKISPNQCPLFGKSCTPETPIGPCMVSTEGSCSAQYRYQA